LAATAILAHGFRLAGGGGEEVGLKNRLGFVVNFARQLSERGVEAERTQALASLESLLERSRLAREDYFYRPPRNDRDRQWLFENRSYAARHWNFLSELRSEHLQ
jgi:hypothetical protein